ncbi:syntaxin-17-like [Acanthaster planci]|uniref:Syntaxin-17-like n=1 Tax=Acanthaster planci TaxID=133434 RepID=A0A8B8A2G7_ACAPL|nr:syntaxin-17-like [Acanthaster planci]XP_022111878.1 syntaxin-17-like [Acanthaster planci]XP_022111879.1 syntaxin-17-like [Acanthaster planci]XP_022111880.1 syntaxin-17-like [Acanthaster planci]XP_022111881.1 syntaxin-17-like [Acanthaster planci]XP_022111882.1 syntaxin-17-like [Acanthaster planci]XP_022111883.1 syntaxin-17-like [Acanthaster planci]XP_022111884.1 syntaxin-17-like [Acanthaster planci]
MAAFGDDETMTSSMYSAMQGTQPLKRFEPSVQKFTKTVVPTDLERLRQHRVNIEKFQKQKNWAKLTTEQVNARQTVQQLKANIREMEKTRSLVIESDLPSFDSRVSPIKEEAILAVMQFIEMNNLDHSPLGEVRPKDSDESDTDSGLRKRHVDSTEDFEVIAAEDEVSEDASVQADDTRERELEHLMQQQTLLQSKESMESLENLQKDLVSLNSLLHQFATHVRVQGEAVDNIADNIDKSEENVTTGRRHLIKASTIKAAVLPVGGAIIGGCLGGPVGLYAGLKVGTVAAIGGSALGFVSGRLLKKRRDKQASVELEEMDRAQQPRRRASDPGPSSMEKKNR